MSFQCRIRGEVSLAIFTKRHLNYWFIFSPRGCLDLKIAIHTSTVGKLTLTSAVVCVTMVAETLLASCPVDVKCCDTGFVVFPCRICVRCALNLSLNVFPVWPTYWRPHLPQLSI